jgi:hypothetical protein
MIYLLNIALFVMALAHENSLRSAGTVRTFGANLRCQSGALRGDPHVSGAKVPCGSGGIIGWL